MREKTTIALYYCHTALLYLGLGCTLILCTTHCTTTVVAFCQQTVNIIVLSIGSCTASLKRPLLSVDVSVCVCLQLWC